jgi:hypothetical protein
MKNFIFFLGLIPLITQAQSTMDSYRWYLEPAGQEVLVSIDDLHDEKLRADPKMDWGRSLVPGLKLKKNIVIAVIDGGIDFEHPELKDKVSLNSTECYEGVTIPPKDGEDKDQNGYKGDCAGWDFVDASNRPEDLDGHGTHVTGVMNSVLAGVNGSVNFLALKVFAPNEGREAVNASAPLQTRLTKAFEYAIERKVDLIHLSVGWPKSYMTYELETTIKKAMDRGIMIVAAAGNSSQRALIYPCQMKGIICVGALRANGDVARFSNWGSQVDVYAPGERILSTIPFRLTPLQISRKGYDYKNGTSQAAPFITASLAILKGLYPQETSTALYSRLLRGADQKIGDKGLRGQFHLDRSVKLAPASFVFPSFKGIHRILVTNNRFNLNLPFMNLGQLSAKSTSVKISCVGARFSQSSFSVPALRAGDETIVKLSGELTQATNSIQCDLKVGSEAVVLKLKVQHPLPVAAEQALVTQGSPLVIQTKTGARSRFITLAGFPNSKIDPIYYVVGEKAPTLYHMEKLLGSLPLNPGCRMLRLWQQDLNADQENDIIVESMCGETHLSYQFLNLQLRPLFEAVSFRPGLTIINYEDFKIIPQRSGAPKIRFMNIGLTPPPSSPWEQQAMSKSNHLYELTAQKDEKGWSYKTTVLEDSQAWIKSLGLRYTPQIQVFHDFGDKLLVKLGGKTAWVDLKTQTASFALLEDILLEGSRRQVLLGTDQYILQSFLTTFEYRGFILPRVKLSYTHQDAFDPLIDVVGTMKNAKGLLTVLRSFQKLIFVQFDDQGNQLSKTENPIDRFDFLTAQDLISSVVNVPLRDQMIQVVDGTKVNTSYVDVIKDGKLKSFEIPFECVTQQPLVMDGAAILPIFCAQDKDHFEMKFIRIAQ